MSFPRYPAYKNSGVKWLGEVPEHWELVPLKRIGHIRYGIGEPPAYVEDGVRLIRATNVHAGKLLDEGMVYVNPSDIPSQRILWLEEGDIIVVRSGAYAGDSSIVPPEYGACIAGFDMVLRIHGADPKYIQHSLLSAYLRDYQIELKRMRAAQPHLNAEELGECILAMPPFDEQFAITDFLDRETAKIDALIAEQQRLIELLQEKRQAVISHAVTKGLNPDAPMKDSGVEWLGEVPEHWEIMGLTKAIGPVVDYRGRTPTKCDSGTLLVTAKNIRHGEIDYSLSEEYVDPLEAEELLQRGRPELGDVLFTMEAPLGQVALVDREDIALAQRVVKFQGIRDRMTNSYLMWWLVGSHCQYQLNSLSTGSTALGIKASKLSAVICAVPPISEQQAIDARIRDFTAQFSSVHAVALDQIELLQERRSALISAAVTGQIDVRGLVPEASAA